VRNEQTDILDSGHFSLELEGNSLICFLFITIKVFQFFLIYTVNDVNLKFIILNLNAHLKKSTEKKAPELRRIFLKAAIKNKIKFRLRLFRLAVLP
jgi:hypothetical protein